MFERFLKSSTETEQKPAEQKPVETVPQRPRVMAPNPAQTEDNSSSENDQKTMSDSLNPLARPPMAPRPIESEELTSEIETLDEEELAALDAEADDTDEEETDEVEEEMEDNSEETLPVEDEPETMQPPAPPSFLAKEEPDSTEGQLDPDEPEELHQPEVYHAPRSGKKEDSLQSSMYSSGGEGRVVQGERLHTTEFADIWFTPEGVAYVRDINTHFALAPIETRDLEDFHRALEQGFTGSSSYAINFDGDTYRVERVQTLTGLQYNCRKMPAATPEIETLGFAPPVIKHLSSLGSAAGLLLFAGPTGQGKTTTASSLMKRFLDKNGGFLYTIEDPPEMPLSGVYHAANGGLGLCKQVPVENDQWGPALRSALRSKPRYILVGEIRTPETASQCLVAATSGHLVISTSHANGVEDALNSLIKYAASSGLAEDLASDLLARGILGVVYQRLEGTTKLNLVYQSAFANPNAQAADQMRMTIRDKNINLATFMEQQKTKMDLGLPMFRE